MKKDILEQELRKVLADAKELQTKCEMEFSTAEFLRKEADKLMEKADKASLDEQYEISDKLDALHGRIQHEIRSWMAGESKLVALETRMNELSAIVESGQYE